MRLVSNAFARPSRKLAPLAVLPLLAATACGGGSGSGDDEFVVASIFAISGAATQPYYVNGVRMAIEDINADGGYDGKKVVLKEYDDGLDAQKAISAARLAIKDGVDVVIGSATVIQTNAIADLFEDAGITYLNMSSSTPVAADESLGGDLTFRMITPQPEQIHGAAQWVTQEMKPEVVGLLGQADDFGKDALPRFEKPLNEGGVETTKHTLFPPDATDLTNETLAMKGTDLIVNWAYPQGLALALKASAQHGLGDIPMLSAGSAALVNSMELVDADLQKNLYGVQACDPVSDQRPHVQEWAKRYEDEYDATADYSSAVSYDAVSLVVAAAEESGSADSEGIAEGLKKVTLDEGTVCATQYRADERQELMHEAVIVNFAGGEPAIVDSYTESDLLGHGTNQG